MKEMLGGCCVCSDDRGWTENPLVYCDGQGCTVAVHQACYGIVTVPSGPWFCRKCESQERAAKVKCELCPSKDGALKKTDNSGWAHVVCALYIPEVRFGNVSTMEPIILSMVPTERFNKICYICESQGKESKAKVGACMNCNKSGCKYHFHVTCAQAMGLLCEEAGNYVDNVKYCGYCQHHYSKLKKGGNLKTIPAFKPLPAPGSTDSGPEKSNPHLNLSSHQSSTGMNGSKDKNRKKTGRKSSSSSQISPKAGNSRDSLKSSVIVETPESEDPKRTYKSEASQFTDVLAGVGLVPGPKTSVSESANVNANSQSEPQDLHEASKPQDHAKTLDAAKSSISKKTDKGNDPFKSGNHPDASAAILDRGRPAKRKNSTRSVSPTSVGGNDTESTLSNVSDCGVSIASETTTQGEQKSADHAADPEFSASVVHSVIVSSNAMHQAENAQQYLKNNSTPQRSVSPLTITGIQSAGGNNKLQVEQSRSGFSSVCLSSEKDNNGPVSATKKPRRGRAPKLSTPLAPDSPPSSPDSNAGGDNPAKRRKKVPRNSATVLPHSNQGHAPFPTNETGKILENLEQTVMFPVSNDHQKISEVSHASAPPEMPVNQQQSMSVAPSNMSSSLLPHSSACHGASKSTIVKQNGIVAPHMLGNQINPTSNVAQKMTETLTAELEANTATHESPSSTKPIAGVPFPPRPTSPSSRSQLPQSLEQLLERQWENCSQFLMEQAQHFDIASLLSHLHSLQIENRKLEDHLATLKKRQEHLLSVKARLSVPLPVTSMNSFSSSGILPDRSSQCPSVLSGQSALSSPHDRERTSRLPPYLPAVENGVGPAEHVSPYVVAGFPSPHAGQRSLKDSGGAHQNDRVIPSPVIVSSRGNAMYHPMGPTSIVPPTMSPVQSGPNYLGEGRSMVVPSSPSSTPEIRPAEMIRTPSTPSQYPLHTQHYAFQMVSPAMPAPPHHTGPLINSSLQGGIASSQQHSLNVRREVPDPRHTVGRPKSIERR